MIFYNALGSRSMNLGGGTRDVLLEVIPFTKLVGQPDNSHAVGFKPIVGKRQLLRTSPCAEEWRHTPGDVHHTDPRSHLNFC